tara:strand:- start:6026 stop:6739 length:714 start_codon:yes stop_codon:yes gene_type:complete
MKVALITGSESQLGKVYINRLLELNYRIIGFDAFPETENSRIEYFRVDITSQREISSVIEKIQGNIDVLVNNAGVSVFSSFEERTEEELDFVMGANLKGTILMIQAVFNRFFKPQKKGCIVNIGSIYGVVAGDMRIYNEEDRRTPEIYGATKAAVINLTKYFAAYMAPYNVRVNCISPGGIFNHQDSEFVSKYSLKVPMGRMGKETELLSTLEYLVSDESCYVTGQNIVVDGGLTVW